MDREDWEAWGAEAPPRDFAAKVVEKAVGERRVETRGRARRIGAGVLLVSSMAAAVALTAQVKNAHAQGDVTAHAREEVQVGGRAIAVLEPGAHVTWKGDAIAQSSGDVFWRVEPGARFVVHTPAADVAVKGTCFRVQVTGEGDEMTRRDAMSGAAGAVMTAAAFVGVYEGKVSVSHAGQSVDVVAGQSARAGAAGVNRVGGGDPESAMAQAGGSSSSESEKALTEANANLADNVRMYRRRLEAIEGEKKKLEKELTEAQSKLNDGGPQRSEYDLSPDDLKDLAKNGEVRMRVPCAGPQGDYSYTPSNLAKLGLAPQDGPILQQAFQQSHDRTWGVIQPLCSQALGGVDVSRIGQQACVSILMNEPDGKGSGNYNEDVREVAEILAGERAAPQPGQPVDPIITAYLALARESASVKQDLTQSIGPDDAQRVAYGETGCWWSSSHGVGPRGGE